MIVNIDRDTRLIISAANHRGSTGVIVQNALFRKFSLNYVYMPFSFKDRKFIDIFNSLKLLNIKGCAVSMPFKFDAYKACDKSCKYAETTSSVNTIIKKDKKYKGYNTDVSGAKLAIESFNICVDSAIVYGTGSVSRSIIAALGDLGCKKIKIHGRKIENILKIENYASMIGMRVDRSMVSSDIVVNCTPVGMNDEETIVCEREIELTKSVFDVVVNNTKLLKKSKLYDKICISGRDMAIYQSLLQFMLYTNHSIDIEQEYNHVKGFFKN